MAFLSQTFANIDQISSRRPHRKLQREASEAVDTPSDDMSFVGADEVPEVLLVGTLVSVAERVWP